MTEENKKEEMLKAYREGKKIQSKSSDGNWEDFIPQNQLDIPNLDYGDLNNWRIKPFDLGKFISWVTQLHTDRGQMYDTKPYVYHLNQVAFFSAKFAEFCKKVDWNDLTAAAIGHDVLEDCGVTYNDIKKQSNKEVAEIIRAVTSDIRGRTRKERMSDQVYEDIRSTPGATFIKLCDRIANVHYSIDTGSRMLSIYREENEEFLSNIDAKRYPEMVQYLNNLFNYQKQ